MFFGDQNAKVGAMHPDSVVLLVTGIDFFILDFFTDDCVLSCICFFVLHPSFHRCIYGYVRGGGCTSGNLG